MFARMLAVSCFLSLLAVSQASAAPIQSYAVYSGGNFTSNTGLKVNGSVGVVGNATIGFDNKLPSISGGGSFQSNSSYNASPAVPGTVIFNGNVSIGYGGRVGDVHSGGTVTGGGDITAGNVYQASAGAINLGWGSTATSLNAGATSPTLQAFTPSLMPAATAHTPGGISIPDVGWMGSVTLAPGDYQALNTNSEATINLSSGDYNFDSMNINSSNIINLDVTNGAIRIVVGGNFSLNNASQWNIIGGGADDVYLELHSNTSLPSGLNFAGTIYLPNSTLTTNSDSTFNGALWAAGGVNLGHNNTINYVASNALPDQFAPPPGPGPGPTDPGDATEVPEPTTLALWGVVALAGYAVRRSRKS